MKPNVSPVPGMERHPLWLAWCCLPESAKDVILGLSSVAEVVPDVAAEVEAYSDLARQYPDARRIIIASFPVDLSSKEEMENLLQTQVRCASQKVRACAMVIAKGGSPDTEDLSDEEFLDLCRIGTLAQVVVNEAPTNHPNVEMMAMFDSLSPNVKRVAVARFRKRKVPLDGLNIAELLELATFVARIMPTKSPAPNPMSN